MTKILNHTRALFLLLFLLSINTSKAQEVISVPTTIPVFTPLEINYTVSGNLQKKITLEANAEGTYSNFGLFVGNRVLIDNIEIPTNRTQSYNFIVNFPSTGNVTLKLLSRSSALTINSLRIDNNNSVLVPEYKEVTQEIGLNYPEGIKYNGPTIADLDWDGDYDFVLNNHNDADAPSVLFLNNGQGTMSQGQILSQFRLMDLHGSSAGDYDNDGDLDLAIALGGGNGTNPQPPVFYKNNDGVFIRSEGDVGINSGARGRSSRWGDFDLDGDLDLALFNAAGINGNNDAQHIFYANKGDGTFNVVSVPGLEKAATERVLMTDLNNDHIDDFVMLSPLSIWKGRGDFSFENVTDKWLPAPLRNKFGSLSAVDIDIDNDNDLDLYIANGLGVFATANRNAVDFNPDTTILDARTSGFTGNLPLTFNAAGDLKLFEIEIIKANAFAGKFPVFLGNAKIELVDIAGDDMDGEFAITQAMATGFPTNRTEDGIYIGYLGNNQWQFESKRSQDLAFSVTFSIQGVSALTSGTNNLGNRNVNDILLRNDINANGEVTFVDVSQAWNIPEGGSHWGVTRGDFNNDSFQDIYINRYGYVRNRRSDYMLLNTGQGGFEVTTNHGANNLGGMSHGDMGQAFDYDLDGDIDILTADDENGGWHLYRNEKNDDGNYIIVKVGYSPVSNVDPISAEVTVTTTSGLSFYRRVGSAGEVFSQSLLNMMHFGLGTNDGISNITVRWRNGEVAEFKDKGVNQVFDTDLLDPTSLSITPNPIVVRVSRSTQATLGVEPIFANRKVNWTSGNESIATVNENGMVSGILEGQSTTITATSVGNNAVSATVPVNVVPFVPIEAESIILDKESLDLVQGNSSTINATVLPADADDKSVIWSSNNTAIATVDQNGIVTATGEGQAIITASLAINNNISDSVIVNVRRLIAASIAFDDRDIYLNTIYSNNGEVNVSVDYHAGTGNTIIAGNNGGVRFLFRHLTPEFGVISDIVVIDDTALGNESGRSTVNIPLNGITPSADLENGEFYFLFVSITTSSGETLNASVFPINVVEGVLSTNNASKDNGIKMFPNPSNDVVSFSGLALGRNYSVTINNLLGQQVYSGKLDETNEISVKNLSKGEYVVILESGSDKNSFILFKED